MRIVIYIWRLLCRVLHQQVCRSGVQEIQIDCKHDISRWMVFHCNLYNNGKEGQKMCVSVRWVSLWVRPHPVFLVHHASWIMHHAVCILYLLWHIMSYITSWHMMSWNMTSWNIMSFNMMLWNKTSWNMMSKKKTSWHRKAWHII